MSDYREGFWKGKKESLGKLGFLHKIIYLKAGLVRSKDQLEWINKRTFLERTMRVLDVGCGYGGSVYTWRQKGVVIQGVEPDPKMAKIVNESLKECLVKAGFFENYTSDYSFDLLLASHVLEHFKDVSIFFNKAKDLQEKGGLVFVEVPCCDNPEVERISKGNLDHVFHFKKEELKKVFEDNDYTVLFIEGLVSYIDHITIPGLTGWQRLIKTVKVVFSRVKSEPSDLEKADVLRVLAVKN